jgi:hypothetical protein
MKKIYFAFIVTLAVSVSGFAQGELDALRYSQNFTGGSARFSAMGGAFGALGGDFSALFVNPAGLGVFRSSEFSFTPALRYNTVETNFAGSVNDEFNYHFNLNQLGFITSFDMGNSEGWSNINIAFGYNRQNNFNGNIIIEGVNNSSSMLDYFANYSDGYFPEELNSFVEFLAYDTWLIDTVTNMGFDDYETILSNYGDDANSTYGQVQQRTLNSKGTLGEYMFSIGANYGNSLYIGASFGIQKLYYYESNEHIEYDPDDHIYDFKSFTYYQDLHTRGKGYSFKMGAIFKPVEMLRLGVAFHLPTFFKLEDEYYSYIDASFDNVDAEGIKDYSSDSPDLFYQYELTTPFKAVGSVAYQFGKRALLSVDYEFVDYSTARLRRGEDGYNFNSENDGIKDVYRKTGNLRIGGEYRLGAISLRGGYAHYGSAYAESEANKDASYSLISAGIGFSQKKFYMDLCYSHMMHEEQYFMYPSANVVPSVNESNTNKFLATFGFKF